MAKPLLTQIGDVLILETRRTFVTYAVGPVSKSGQTDFHGSANVTHLNNRSAAIELAHTLVMPGRRIVHCDIDSDVWSVISH